jgi:hypothetical protein
LGTGLQAIRVVIVAMGIRTVMKLGMICARKEPSALISVVMPLSVQSSAMALTSRRLVWISAWSWKTWEEEREGGNGRISVHEKVVDFPSCPFLFLFFVYLGSSGGDIDDRFMHGGTDVVVLEV